MKRIVVVIGVWCLAFLALPVVTSAQSKEDGIRLWNEGWKLHQEARSTADLEAAIEKYQNALHVFKKHGYKEGTARVTNNMGLVFKDLTNYEKAAECYLEALALAREIGDETCEGWSLNNLGIVYQSQGKYDKALKFYDKSMSLSAKRGDRKMVGRTLNNIGEVYRLKGQYDEAVVSYEKSTAVSRKVGDEKTVGNTLNNLGIVYQNRGQYDKATEFYEKSMAISRKVGDQKTLGRTLNNLGEVHRLKGQYTKALESYDKSITISRKIGDREMVGRTLNNLGLVYQDWGQYDKSLDAYEKSIAIARKIGDRQMVGRTLNNLGEVYRLTGRYDRAVGSYEKSTAIAEEIGDREAVGNALNNLGLVYKDWGQYDKAVEYYKRSLTVAQTIGNPRGAGRTLNNVGMVFADWGRYDKAVEYYLKSLSISEEIGDRRMVGKTFNNLGLVYWDWGRYGKAVEFYEKSLKVADEVGSRPGEGRIFNNLGLVYADWGQYDRAVEYYHKALSISREIGDRQMVGKTLNNLGLVYAHRGEYEAALKNYQMGLAIYEELKVPTKWPKNLVANLYLDKGDLAVAEPLVREAGYWSTLGRFFLLSSNYGKSKDYYEKLQTHAEKNRNANNLFTAYTGLGLTYEGMGKDADAAKCYRTAVLFTEELRSTLTPAQREKFFDVMIAGFYRTEPYEGLARVLMKMKNPEDAFTTSEYTRARLFAEALTRLSDGTGSDVPVEVFKEDKDLNDKIAAMKKSRQKAYEKNDKLLIKSLEPQIVAMEAKFHGHVEMLREKYPLFAATRYPQPMALPQTALEDNEWVLSYDVTDLGLIVYLTKGKSLVKALFKKTPRKELDKLVRAFRKPLEMKAGDSFVEKLEQFDFAAGKKLTDILLADILPEIPEKTPLIVVPDDSLGVLPFDMLVLNNGGHVKSDRRVPYTSGAYFFGDRNPISYYQSVTALTLARTFAQKRHSHPDVLIMDDPVFEADDPRLKSMGRSERTRLQKSLPGNLMSVRNEIDITFDRLPLTAKLGESLTRLDPAKTRRYTGLDASKSTLLDSPLERYGSMVFATHGYFGRDLPGVMEPVLILTLVGQPKGRDGYFRMSEVMGLKIDADIVALTACQTGLGRRLTGEGVMGMGRAFQYAGAKTALMSLWTVDEKASVNLVESFFRHLKAGESKLRALELAKGEIRNAGYDHPFFWAPFILVGEVR